MLQPMAFATTSPGYAPRAGLFHDRPGRWGIAFAAAAFVALAAAPLSAATFRVNSTADTDDGVCGAATGECTLREAIAAVVATSGRDTIRFAPDVFVAGTDPARIDVGELPIIADPAGTVIDGTGASVRIHGSTMASGLVFASAPDTPLGKVTVRNVSIQGFGHHGIHVCGGVPPECDSDVAGALVRNVAVVNCEGSGIRIEGRVNKKARVLDSVTFGTGNDGIRLTATQQMIGARVERCTATRAGGSGIALRAERQTGSAVRDSLGLKSVLDGIEISDDGATVKPTIIDVVAFGNRSGIALHGYELIAPTVANAVTSGNEVGVKVLVSHGSAAVAITKVVADANLVHGINIEGGGDMTIARARVVANAYGGIATESSYGVDVADVTAVANQVGVDLASSSGVVTRVHAGANENHGIRVHEPGGYTIVQNVTLANALYASGISIAQDSGENTVRDNVSVGHIYDLYDDNRDCGTNVWSANTFIAGAKPCIR
jgi:CSLREA domain-containing protein